MRNEVESVTVKINLASKKNLCGVKKLEVLTYSTPITLTIGFLIKRIRSIILPTSFFLL